MEKKGNQRKKESGGLEQAFADKLEHGEMESPDPEKNAMKRLTPPYEIRVRTEKDPILEETKRYRDIAEEVDDRYDVYVEAAKKRGDRKGRI